MGALLAGHLKEVIDHVELNAGWILEITTDNASSHYSMTSESQTSFEAFRIDGPALRNLIPCMAHII
jgi:hypothetical protein